MKEPSNLDDTVPGRLSAAELRAMALRQQQQIDNQHQLLAAKEQRLRFLKAQESRGANAVAEGERLRRLRERVEAQESKLRRLRALRGQADLQKSYNATLSNDLDSIRALFSEKEKELSLAVAKVEALTRQLEELRRDRRGLNLIANNGNNQQAISPAARELEKLRRELMYRNQLSLQQDARLQLQREALQQRQAELRSVDQRIVELQGRLHRKKAANLLLQQQKQNETTVENVQAPVTIHVRSSSTHIYPPQRNVRGNIAAVEPYNHTPQKSSSMMTSNHQHQQIIQDLAMLKLKSQHSPSGNFLGSESDESKIARQKQMQHKQQTEMQPSSHEINNIHSSNSSHSSSISSNIPSSMSDAKNTEHFATNNQTMPFKHTANSGLNVGSTSLLSHKIISSVLAASANHHQQQSSSSVSSKLNDCDGDDGSGSGGNCEKERKPGNHTSNKSKSETNADEKPAIKPKALHQIPSGNLVVPPRKPISSVAPTSITIAPKTISQAPKVHIVAPNNNIQAPLLSSSVNNNNHNNNNNNEQDLLRPALPPKPSKNNNHNGQQMTSNENENLMPNDNNNLPIKAKPLTIKKQPFSEQPPKLRSLSSNHKTIQYNASRRIEMPPSFLFPEIATTELKDGSNDINGNNVNSTSIISKLVNGSVCMPSTMNNMSSGSQDDEMDETDKSATPSSLLTIHDEQKPSNIITDSVVRRKRNLIGENVKAKLARRVSFDPLALLLDASLEGELELVRKTCSQVPNPSAANDEGITALHNAICAGHFEIVKFLAQFGCDVNAQDSDGWTPLHCAASCNNLPMVRFLVESGACLFASTLSDHETPAEKCEEDEEGFDGCSEYLYSIQEKLGILNSGEVYAVFSYDAQQQDELKFTVNDKLTILRKGDESEREWWWARTTDGIEGYVPRNLFGLYPRIDPSLNPAFND